MANNTIALLSQAPVLDTPLESQSKAMQIRNMMNQGQMQDMDMQAKRDTIQRAAGLRGTLASFKPGATADEQVDTLTRGGYLPEARSLAESSSKVSKEKREAEKFQFEHARDQLNFINQVIGAAKDQVSYSQGRQAMQSRGMDVSQIPEQFDPNYVKAAGDQTMTHMQQLEQVWKQKGFDLDVEKFGEDKRKNSATERNQAGQLAVSQANLGVSRQREAREASAPRGQIVQTDQGVMMVNPRDGTAQPVMAGGVALQPKLKDIPASVNTAIIANSQSLAQLDKTIQLLEGKSADGQTGDSAATGMKGYLPQQMLNTIDPKGIDARAGVADIGSLKLHDRSGAAVTAAESPRLMPFIPTATDSNDTALKKLRRLRQEVASESTALGETYSKDQGYRPNPVLKRGSASAPVSPTTNAKGWVLHTDASGNKAYVSPDGKSFEEAK